MRKVSGKDSDPSEQQEDVSFRAFSKEISDRDHTAALVILIVLFAVFVLFQFGSIIFTALFLNIAAIVYALGDPKVYRLKSSELTTLVRITVLVSLVVALFLKLEDGIILGILLFSFFTSCVLAAARSYGPEEAAHPTLLRGSMALLAPLALLLVYFET